MKLELQRIDDAFHLEATNEDGLKAYSDAAVKVGGGNKAFRPMQLLLMSAASCSSIDILSILKKQRQEVKDFHVTIDGDREDSSPISLFKEIRIHYVFKGDLNDKKVERAIDLSINKYCSASKTLEKAGATIKTSFEIQN